MIARIFDQFLINQDTTYKLFLCMRFASRYKLKHERDSLASVFIRHAYGSLSGLVVFELQAIALTQQRARIPHMRGGGHPSYR